MQMDKETKKSKLLTKPNYKFKYKRKKTPVSENKKGLYFLLSYINKIAILKLLSNLFGVLPNSN